MSSGDHVNIGRWVAVAVAIVIGSGLAGWWLATVTAPDYSPAQVAQDSTPPAAAAEAPAAPSVERYTPPTPPLYFYARTHRGADLDLVESEMRMAAAAGIHQFIVSAPLAWADDEQIAELARRLDTIPAMDDAARVIIELELDPPQSWLAEHPRDVVMVDGNSLPFACPASLAWQEDVTARLTDLADALSERKFVTGILLAALDDGEWRLPAEPDTSPANVDGFRQWMATRYVTDEAVRARWEEPGLTLAELNIPAAESGVEEGAADRPQAVDAAPRSDVAWNDYREYVSDVRVDAIVACTKAIKATHETLDVWVRYGYTFSASAPASGHFALGRLLLSPVDAIVYPAAAIERGLGGVGGYAGPVNSIIAHGKRCILLDDTFTGLAKNAESGEIERVRGMSYETVSQIHHRNFASALSHGLGLAWVDPEGDGRLHDPELWEQFSHMGDLYRNWYKRRHELETAPVGKQSVPFPPGGAGLAVVVDEKSRAWDPNSVQGPIVASVVSAALRSGVQIEFLLLDDYLQGIGTDAPAAVFANCFRLDDATRALLHERLAQRGAAAIWLYAPGAMGTTAGDAAGVSATVGMRVERLDETPSGSTYAFDSHWIRAGDTFAGEGVPPPLFCVDDENADVLATFTETNRASVALATTPDGWASIFVAEARLPSELLHEILQLLDIASVSRNYESPVDNAYFLGPHTLALHTNSDGETFLDFGLTYDVHDMTDPAQGWLGKTNLAIPTDEHETRLLTLTPSIQSTPVETQSSAAPIPPAEEPAPSTEESAPES